MPVDTDWRSRVRHPWLLSIGIGGFVVLLLVCAPLLLEPTRQLTIMQIPPDPGAAESTPFNQFPEPGSMALASEPEPGALATDIAIPQAGSSGSDLSRPDNREANPKEPARLQFDASQHVCWSSGLGRAQHKDVGPSYSTGTWVPPTAQGRGSLLQHMDVGPSYSTGTWVPPTAQGRGSLLQHRDVGPSYSTGTWVPPTAQGCGSLLQHRDVGPSYSTGTWVPPTAQGRGSLLQHRDVGPSYSTGTWVPPTAQGRGSLLQDSGAHFPSHSCTLLSPSVFLLTTVFPPSPHFKPLISNPSFQPPPFNPLLSTPSFQPPLFNPLSSTPPSPPPHHQGNGACGLSHVPPIQPFPLPSWPFPPFPTHLVTVSLPFFPTHLVTVSLPSFPTHLVTVSLPSFPTHLVTVSLPSFPTHLVTVSLPSFPTHLVTVSLPSFPTHLVTVSLPSFPTHLVTVSLPSFPTHLVTVSLPSFPPHCSATLSVGCANLEFSPEFAAHFSSTIRHDLATWSLVIGSPKQSSQPGIPASARAPGATSNEARDAPGATSNEARDARNFISANAASLDTASSNTTSLNTASSHTTSLDTASPNTTSPDTTTLSPATPCAPGSIPGRWKRGFTGSYYWTFFPCAPSETPPSRWISDLRRKGIQEINMVGNSHQRVLANHLHFLLSGHVDARLFFAHASHTLVASNARGETLRINFYWIDGIYRNGEFGCT
ncbi:unnamed protein product, partial [Closterium sp. Yama58-4]